MKIIAQKVSELRGLGKCLELGCGIGTYSKLLANNSDNVLATDFSQEMVAEAQLRLAEDMKITVKQANAEQLPYEDNSFNTVFMANLLHVIPDPVKALQEARRVLSERGRLIIISFTTEGMTFLNRMGMFYRYMRTYGKPSPHASILSMRQVRSMLFSTNFDVMQAMLIGQRNKAIFVDAVCKKTVRMSMGRKFAVCV